MKYKNRERDSKHDGGGHHSMGYKFSRTSINNKKKLLLIPNEPGFISIKVNTYQCSGIRFFIRLTVFHFSFKFPFRKFNNRRNYLRQILEKITPTRTQHSALRLRHWTLQKIRLSRLVLAFDLLRKSHQLMKTRTLPPRGCSFPPVFTVSNSRTKYKNIISHFLNSIYTI